MLECFVFQFFFKEFFKIILETKTVFLDVLIHLDNFYASYILGGIFDPKQFFFLFLVALTKKNYAPSKVFSPEISSNWPILQAETSVTELHCFAMIALH